MPALSAAAFSSPLLYPPACLAQPLSVIYPIAPAFNDFICLLNTFFIAGTATPAGKAFLDYFGGLFVPAVLVAVYEGFRPSSRRSASSKAYGNAEGFGMHLGLAQLSTFAITVGQVFMAGVALPLYYAFVSASTPNRWRHHHHKKDLGDDVFLPKELREDQSEPHKHSVQYNANIPRSSFVYTTLISTIVGMVLPSLYMSTAPPELKYDALTIFHPFPVYMLLINIVLPPLLRRSFTSVNPMRGIYLIAALGIAASLKSQYQLFTQHATVPITDVFMLNANRDFLNNVEALGESCHLLFILDFVFVALATGSKVVLALARRARSGTVGRITYTIILLAGACVVGPGAAIMVMWAYSEREALRHAQEYTDAKKATEGGSKKKTK